MTEYLSTKEVAVRVRAELKATLPQWKFSVSFKSFSMGSSIDLALMQGPEAVCAGTDGGYAQLNKYTFYQPDSYRPLVNSGVLLTKTGWEVMEQATKILAKYHEDSSDIQSDYFCCNFYIHIAIGKWDKPYTVKETK